MRPTLRPISVTLLLMGAVPAASVAQVSIGDRVRTQGTSAVLVGHVVRITDSTIVIRGDRRDSVLSRKGLMLERAAGTNALPVGTALGLAGAVITGLLAAEMERTMGDPRNAPQTAMSGAAIGGGAGFLIGALLGTASARWVPVSGDRAVSVSPRLAGRSASLQIRLRM